MAAPIDEGAPIFSSRTNSPSLNYFNGSNFATAIRAHIFDQRAPATGEGEVDLTIYFDTGAGLIHDHTQFKVTENWSVFPPPAGNLHLLNPIGYKDRYANRIVRDLLVHQAHAGHGQAILNIVGDQGTNQWTRSTGAGTHASHVDEDVTDPVVTDYLESTTPGQIERLVLTTAPSNHTLMHELIVTAWLSMTVGTDTGMGISVTLKSSAGAILGRSSGQILDCHYDGVIRQAQVKIEGINAALASGAYLEIESKRGSAGGTPNPRWRLYAIQALGYYEVSAPDPIIIDESSLSALDALFSSHLLDFDVHDGTFRSALMDVMAHAPNLGAWMAYTGALKFGAIDAYADTASPRALSTLDGTIEAVERGLYRVDERTANAIVVKWGVQVPHVTSGTADKDPVNPPTERGSRRLQRATSWVIRKGAQTWRDLDRHFIRSLAVASALADHYLEQHETEIDGLDVQCPLSEIVNECNDVVSVSIPELSIEARRFRVVEKTLDPETHKVHLVLYDIENTL